TSLLANLGLYDKSRTEELLLTVREEAERLDRFVGNLLDMSRLEAGALGVKSEWVDVGEMVDAALQRLARRLAGHHVVQEIPSDLPFAKADPLLLEQALVNLLDNAAKYAPVGSTITVHGEVDARKIALSIADEGPGIPDTELSHIFDKFYRARKGDSGAAGTGLGLSVARGFVEAFGGTLSADNRKGARGAVFTLTMPVGEKPGEGDHGK
ncbi:MAG TPA: ATP-binding protein, partial [Rhizomicrobium sp.]|nr:ATP-binding protein [Rhizomicrobium sp.]